MKSKLLHDGGEKTWVLIFDKGDEVVSDLTRFAEEQRLGGSRFTAIGAFSDVSLGYFDREGPGADQAVRLPVLRRCRDAA